MGWLCCLAFMISYWFLKDNTLLYLSAIFAVSGSISEVAVQIKRFTEKFDFSLTEVDEKKDI